MPVRPQPMCAGDHHRCPRRATRRGLCDEHYAERQREYDARRPNATQRGYDQRWRDEVRPEFLAAHPWCKLCGHPSNVPDHWPRSRRELVAAGVDDPDDWRYLRALCKPCHDRETAKNQPGGWANRT